MPVHRTRDARHQNARIDSRTLLLLFKCYEQLCLHEAILTCYLGTSAIWSVRTSGSTEGWSAQRASVFEGRNEVGSSRRSMCTLVGVWCTLLIERHGIDKAMQVEAARVQFYWWELAW
jgi:hypothetical protein